MEWRSDMWKGIGFGLLVAVLFLLPYCQFAWWQYFHTSLALLALWGLRWRREGMPRLGLGLRRRDLIGVPLCFGAICLGARRLQAAVAEAHGLERRGFEFPENVDPLYQALNEELLLGYLLLRGLSRWLTNPHALAWAVSVAFAALHVVFYRWTSSFFEWLTPSAIVALVFVGLARNYLILAAGHVGYAWALHGAWNLGFFGGRWYRTGASASLGEPEMFDVFLGQPIVIGAAAGAAAVAAGWMFRRGSSALTGERLAPSDGARR